MLTEETNNKLTETLAICDLHHQRMMFAYLNIEKLPEEVEKLAGIWIKLKEYTLTRLTTEIDE